MNILLASNENAEKFLLQIAQKGPDTRRPKFCGIEAYIEVHRNDEK
jgi:hypothetical protein